MANSCVLITRPATVAKSLFDDCVALGLEVLHHPLIEIVPIDSPLTFPDNAIIVFTSQNALTEQVINSLPKHTEIFAVGEQTAGRLRKAGFTKIKAAKGNGLDLLKQLKQLPIRKPITHVCGDTIRVDIAAELKNLGYAAKSLEVYKTKINTELPTHIITALQQQHVQLLPLFSPRTASILMDIFNNYSIKTSNIKAICVSQAVADILQNKSWKKISIQPKITAESICKDSGGELIHA